MEKTLSLLLALLMLAALLTGCGQNPESQPAPETPVPTEAPAATETPATPEPTPAPTEEPTPAPTPETPDFDPAELHPMLWKVTDPQGHSLYLFGTIHVGDGRNSAVLEKLSPILLGCDALAVEFDLVAYQEDLNAVMADYQQFVYADGTTVKDHMPEELYTRCTELLGEIGAYSPLLDYYNLGMWSQLTEQAALMTRSDLDPEFAMDSLLIHLAYDHEIPVRSVESAAFQMGLLNSFPDELDLLMIRETLDNLDEYGESIDELYSAWLSGDYDAILALNQSEEGTEDYTEEELALVADYNRAMLDDRNVGMAETAKEYLAAGDTVFFAVGAGHLVGDMGLVQLLRDAGFTVERVDY